MKIIVEERAFRWFCMSLALVIVLAAGVYVGWTVRGNAVDPVVAEMRETINCAEASLAEASNVISDQAWLLSKLNGGVTTASWYGPQEQGNLTANGERFDMNLRTCAHRTLPFGTRVMVVNLDNGRVTYGRINDRGPWINGRGIDLSRMMANDLKMIREGLARVLVIAVPSEIVSGRASMED